MKFWQVLFLVLLLNAGALQAEWRRSGGPNGGIVNVIDAFNDDVWCIAGHGVHHLVDGKWRRTGAGDGNELKVWRDKLYSRDVNSKNRIMIVSDDAGESWRPVSLPLPQKYIYLFKLNDVLHVRPESMFIGVDKTVYRSTDGEEWTAIGDCEECGSGIARVFGTDETIFVSYAGDDRLHRYSTDGSELAPVMLPDVKPSISIFLADGTHIYAISGSEGAFRSDDQGETWEEINSNFQRPYKADLVPAITYEAAYDNRIIALDRDKYLWHFDGVTWTIKQNWINLSQLLPVEDRIYTASNVGVLISDDDGDNWQNYSAGLPYTNCIDMFAVDASLFAVTTVNVFRSDDNGLTWDIALDSTLHNVTFDGGTMYAVHGRRETRAVPKTLYSSEDRGQTWELLNNDLWLDDPRDGLSQGNWNSAISDIDHNGRHLFLSLHSIEFGDGGGGGGNSTVWKRGGMRRSADGGQSWEKVNNGLPDMGDVSVPVIEILSNERGVLINTEAGLYFSDDDGDQWQSSMNGIGPETEVTHIFGQGLTVFATVFSRGDNRSHNFVYRSDDGGANWREMVDAVNPEFPEWNLIPQRIDFVDGDIYMHTRTSAYYRLFKLENDVWLDVQSEVPPGVRFRQIVGHDGNRFATAEQNGIWIDPATTSDVKPKQSTVSVLHRVFPNPFGSEITVESGAHRGAMQFELFNMAGEIVLTRSLFTSGRERLTLEAAKSLTAGAYVYRITSEAGESRGMLLHH